MITSVALAGRQAGAQGEGRWIQRAALPTPRQEVAVARLEGRVYVIGGITGEPGVTGVVEVYDPETNTWSSAAPLPTPAHHAGAASVGERLFVVGGFSDLGFQQVLGTLLEYDPETDTWTERAPLPEARGALAAAGLQGLLYAAGGWPEERQQDFSVYDPASDEWTALPDMPSGRNHLALVPFTGSSAPAGGLLVAAGGRVGSLGPQTNTDAVERFDPQQGSWSTGEPMPTARSGVAGAELGGRGILFGGEGNPEDPDGVFDDTEAYDPIADTWTSLTPMPTGRHGIGAASVAGRVYIPGGSDVEGFGVTAVHEVFVPEPPASLGALAALLTITALSRRSRRLR